MQSILKNFTKNFYFQDKILAKQSLSKVVSVMDEKSWSYGSQTPEMLQNIIQRIQRRSQRVGKLIQMRKRNGEFGERNVFRVCQFF